MKNYLSISLSLLLLGSGLCSGQADITASRATALTQAIRNVSPAVASISVTQIKEYRASPYFQDPFWQYFFPEHSYRQRVKNSGSGVVISPDGYILTNHHVVENASEITVTLPGGKRYNAEIIGSDRVSDVGLLKINDRNLPYAQTGDSDELVIGEWVIALGNPFGLFDVNNQPTATAGIISALNMDFGRQNAGHVYQDMIQTDASINVGNSGGPLVNSHGEVIGINTFIFTGSGYSQGSIGIGFAIPINRARRIAEELKNSGRVDRSFTTGLKIQNLTTQWAKYLDLPFSKGVFITEIESGSAAEAAKLKPGDVILEVNGRPVNRTDDIFKIIEEGELRAGDNLTLTVFRDGRKKKVTFQLRKA